MVQFHVRLDHPHDDYCGSLIYPELEGYLPLGEMEAFVPFIQDILIEYPLCNRQGVGLAWGEPKITIVTSL